jgi:hypothetical protein
MPCVRRDKEHRNRNAEETMRSAHRGVPTGYQLNDRKDSVGFRVARTLPN